MSKDFGEGIRITILKNVVAIPLLVLAALFPMAAFFRSSDNLIALFLLHSLPFAILGTTLMFPSRFYEKTFVFGIIGAGISGFIAELVLYGWLWYYLAHYKGGGAIFFGP